jgi:type IV pilus assembly protein PilX
MKRQRGTVLLMALMFLIVLSLLGIAMVSSTSVEERMARNARDQDVAMQAAEAALRDARIRITGYHTNPATPLSTWDFYDDCTNGLCSRNAAQPVWTQFGASSGGDKSVALGTGTNSPTLIGVQAAPRYLIERFIIQRPGDSMTGPGITAHRITSKGTGRTNNTSVIVQEVVIL